MSTHVVDANDVANMAVKTFMPDIGGGVGSLTSVPFARGQEGSAPSALEPLQELKFLTNGGNNDQEPTMGTIVEPPPGYNKRRTTNPLPDSDELSFLSGLFL